MATEDRGDLRTIERSLELLLKLKVQELKGDRSQSEMILLLDSLGLKSGETVKVLGAPPASVRPILSRAHTKKRK